VANPSAFYRQALADALDDARAKAAALGKAGGFTVGQVLTVTEASATPPPMPFAAAPAKGASTPVEPGSQDVTADVTVSFSIA
jgi:uncharacterized protein YggE